MSIDPQQTIAEIALQMLGTIERMELIIPEITDTIRKALEQHLIAIPFEEYHEDMGPVLWWRFPIEEPPYVGMPIDFDWAGYHTHFTPLVCPVRSKKMEASCS